MSYVLKAYAPGEIVGTQPDLERLGFNKAVYFRELNKKIQDELKENEQRKYTLDFIKSLLTADDDRSDEQIMSDIEMIILQGRFPT